jgi:hypothetical protein
LQNLSFSQWCWWRFKFYWMQLCHWVNSSYVLKDCSEFMNDCWAVRIQSVQSFRMAGATLSATLSRLRRLASSVKLLTFGPLEPG